MHYGNIKMFDSADGDGVRVSLFVSGCRNHCPGCFSQVTWDFDYGNEFTEMEAGEIIEGCKRPFISGLSVLGGDPLEPENQIALVDFLERYKVECPDKTLWMYTGYVLERDLLSGKRNNVEGVTERILDLVDVLVDGPFMQGLKDLRLRFRGSSNQRILTKEDIRKLRSSESSG